jgi:hypothetical protein
VSPIVWSRGVLGKNDEGRPMSRQIATAVISLFLGTAYAAESKIVEVTVIDIDRRDTEHWHTYVVPGYADEPSKGHYEVRGTTESLGLPDGRIAKLRDFRFAVELFQRKGKHVGIVDLILVATAKYLMDFFDIPKPYLHIVTLDTPLREGIAAVNELPKAYDPTMRGHRAEVVFE